MHSTIQFETLETMNLRHEFGCVSFDIFFFFLWISHISLEHEHEHIPAFVLLQQITIHSKQEETIQYCKPIMST